MQIHTLRTSLRHSRQMPLQCIILGTQDTLYTTRFISDIMVLEYTELTMRLTRELTLHCSGRRHPEVNTVRRSEIVSGETEIA